MKIQILNRRSGKVQFVAEITDSGSVWINIGLAVKWAINSGVNLSHADLSGANLSGAKLSGANLRGAKLSDANLRDAKLSDANLSDANLRGAKLSDANLSGADLSGAILHGADLSGAILPHLDITPVIADIHQAVYAAASSKGALDMSNWHSDCGTAHCWAGWVVTLAGEQGKALEKKTDTSVAAALILMKSDPDLKKIPSWFSTNGEALAEMKKLAA